MSRVTTVLIFLSLLAAGGIFLQIFLSRMECKWPGLVLPAITFLTSILMILSVAAINDIKAVIATILGVLISGNISTLILLAIYAACRSRRKKQSEVEKMSIEDL